MLVCISKRGSQQRKSLLVDGARSRSRTVARITDPFAAWVDQLRRPRDFNRATVAVANTNARITWAVFRCGEPYRAARRSLATKLRVNDEMSCTDRIGAPRAGVSSKPSRPTGCSDGYARNVRSGTPTREIADRCLQSSRALISVWFARGMPSVAARKFTPVCCTVPAAHTSYCPAGQVLAKHADDLLRSKPTPSHREFLSPVFAGRPLTGNSTDHGGKVNCRLLPNSVLQASAERSAFLPHELLLLCRGWNRTHLAHQLRKFLQTVIRN